MKNKNDEILNDIDVEDKEYLQNRSKPQGYDVVMGFIEASKNAIAEDKNMLSPEMVKIIDKLEAFLKYDGPVYEIVYKTLSRAIKILVAVNTLNNHELFNGGKYPAAINICGINIAVILDIVQDEIDNKRFDFTFCEIKFSETQLLESIIQAAKVDSEKLHALWKSYSASIDEQRDAFMILNLQLTHLIGSLAADSRKDEDVKSIFAKIVNDFWDKKIQLDDLKFNQIKVQKLARGIALGIVAANGTIKDLAAQYGIPEKYIDELEITDDDFNDIMPTASDDVKKIIKGK